MDDWKTRAELRAIRSQLELINARQQTATRGNKTGDESWFVFLSWCGGICFVIGCCTFINYVVDSLLNSELENKKFWLVAFAVTFVLALLLLGMIPVLKGFFEYSKHRKKQKKSEQIEKE